MSGTDRLCFYFNKGWLDFVGRTLKQDFGNGWTENVMAERVGFEPTLPVRGNTLSKRAPSATRPSLPRCAKNDCIDSNSVPDQPRTSSPSENAKLRILCVWELY